MRETGDWDVQEGASTGESGGVLPVLSFPRKRRVVLENVAGTGQSGEENDVRRQESKRGFFGQRRMVPAGRKRKRREDSLSIGKDETGERVRHDDALLGAIKISFKRWVG